MQFSNAGLPQWLGLLATVLLLNSMLPGTSLFGQTVDEYEVKAAFLYNFTKFVEWSNIPAPDVFNICIVGDDPFGLALDQLVKGKTAYNRKIQIRRLKEPGEARQCQIVFMRREEEVKAARVIEAVRGMQVLTVSERRKFATMGGMVVFLMKEGHLTVSINSEAVENAGLRVSAKLMSLAKNSENESEER